MPAFTNHTTTETILTCPSCNGQIFRATFVGAHYMLCQCSLCSDQLMFEVMLGAASYLGRGREAMESEPSMERDRR